MVVRRREGDGVPDPAQRLLLVVCLQADLDDADIVRLRGCGVRELREQLVAGLKIARRAAVQQVHLDNLIHVPSCTPAARPGNLRAAPGTGARAAYSRA